MPKAKYRLVGRSGREGRSDGYHVQDKGVSGVRPKEGELFRDARVIRHTIFDPTQLLFHHAHLQSGKEPPARCICRKGRLAGVVVTVEQELPRESVGESVGVDEEGPAAPPPDSQFWPWD